MPERETLLKITKVTDDDTGMYHIGEIDGMFQYHQLQEYLTAHGLDGLKALTHHLAFLQYQVHDHWRNFNSGNDDTQCCSADSPVSES